MDPQFPRILLRFIEIALFIVLLSLPINGKKYTIPKPIINETRLQVDLRLPL